VSQTDNKAQAQAQAPAPVEDDEEEKKKKEIELIKKQNTAINKETNSFIIGLKRIENATPENLEKTKKLRDSAEALLETSKDEGIPDSSLKTLKGSIKKLNEVIDEMTKNLVKINEEKLKKQQEQLKQQESKPVKKQKGKKK